MTSAGSELVGGEALTPLFGTRVPVLAHPLVEPDKGTGLVMVCTFGDLTDVIWWRELSLPVRAVLGEDGRLVDVPWGEPGWESEDVRARARELCGAARAQRQPGAPAHRRAAGASPAIWSASPSPSTARSSSSRRASARSRSSPAASGSSSTVEHREALIARGRELHWHPAVHARALRGLGERPERRLVRQPPALLRRAVPDLVSDRRRRRGPLRPSRSPRARTAAGRSLDGRSRRLRRPTARAARRLRRRPRRDGHVGDLLADAADRGQGGRGRGAVQGGLPDGPAPAGARHHQDLAVLDDPALAPGRRRAAVARCGDLRLGARPRPQEDVEVQGQRRHADAPARGARRRRRALLGGERAPGRPTRPSTPSRCGSAGAWR